ncbi:sigma-70 family RNA polymerase sigma factor [Sporolactobacillus shoreae]|nr:sigma-70 family RNA polymerase sigma factor [Sporolactobacillus shoreae]
MKFSETLSPVCHRSREIAYETLLKKFNPLIHSQVKRFCEEHPYLKGNHEEDLKQEAREALWRADDAFDVDLVPKEYNTCSRFIAYLKTTIDRRLKRYLDKHYKYHTRHNFEDSIEEYMAPDDFQQQVVLECLLATLDRNERSFYHLHMIQGYTIQQIADIHGVHRSTVRKWKKSTFAKLSLRYKEDE